MTPGRPPPAGSSARPPAAPSVALPASSSAGAPSGPPAAELIAAGFELENADAPLLHHGINLADIAHVLDLHRAGVIPQDAARRMLVLLLETLQIPADQFPYEPEFGEPYNSRERYFAGRVGDVAGWLHAGRPRREAMRIAFRLHLRDALVDLIEAAADLAGELGTVAAAHAGTLMADQTYLQHAQPSTFGHYLLSFAFPVLREGRRLDEALTWTDASPGGAGCVNGNRLRSDRANVARLLGFRGVAEHTRDAMWQTDGLFDMVGAATGLLVTQSKLAEDLEIWASQEFDYVTLADAYSRASVLMPQKRNPYALSIIRGAAGTMIGRLTGLLAVAKTPSARSDSLIFAYGEVPRALELALRTTRLSRGMVRTLEVNAARLSAALEAGFSQATDIAEYIMQACGIDYRTAYRVVGHAVREASAAGLRGIDIDGPLLDRSAMAVTGRSLHLTGHDLSAVLDPLQIVQSRTALGGAAPAEVTRMAADVRQQATGLAAGARQWRDAYQRAENALIAAAHRCVGDRDGDGDSLREPAGRAPGSSRQPAEKQARAEEAMTDPAGTAPSLPKAVSVVNIGLPLFADAVAAQGADVVSVDWRVPAGGQPEAVAALGRLYGRHAGQIDAANAEVVRRLDTGAPLLTGVRTVAQAVPGLPDRTLLHCGPVIGYGDAPDPLRRSMRAAVVAQGWAAGPQDAHRLLDRGEIGLRPANEHRIVVPMATVLEPGAPVYVVENRAGGTTAFAPICQGPGDVAWFGCDNRAAIARLGFLRDVAAPVIRQILELSGPLDVLALAAQAVTMGDDIHVRTQAATNLLIREWLPHLAGLADPARVAFARFLSGNHLFFLTIAMAAARSLTEWAGQVQDASIVTTMARNGTTFGIRLAGSDRWFTAEAPEVGHALYYPDQGPQTSARDIGDSAVLELAGLGAAAAAGSPAVAQLVGGSMGAAAALTDRLAAVCAGQSGRFRVPALEMAGTPLGVDVRRVVELGVTPAITTGILHRSAGTGQVGAGVAEAPIGCFADALAELDMRLGGAQAG